MIEATDSLHGSWYRVASPSPTSWRPAWCKDHRTLGASWLQPGGGDWSGFFADAPQEAVSGSTSIPRGNPPGLWRRQCQRALKETIIGVSYTWKL